MADERSACLVRVFRAVHDIQAGVAGGSETLAALARRARSEGWDDVERACVFGEAVSLWIAGDTLAAARVRELVERSTEAGDTVMLALGLAMRADQSFCGTDLIGTVTYDAELARAVVLLEDGTTRPHERITAYTACAIALGGRWLFELSNEQYQRALAIGAGEPRGSVDFLLAPIRFNMAEQQVNWASKLYELGDHGGVSACAETWWRVAAAAEEYPMAESWRVELDALGIVLRALCGDDVVGDATALVSALRTSAAGEGRAGGLLRLAVAVSVTDRPGAPLADADAAIEAAVASISPAIYPFLYDLALFLAARLEDRRGSGAGLRYARRTVEELWAKREASDRAMRAHITSVRLVAERDALSCRLGIDELTGIANRRALEAFLTDLVERGVEHCALVSFDVDSFKAVNDLHGHLAGDRLLVRIAQVLASGVGPSDLAVRLGGDEFAVVLVDVDPVEALAQAEALMASFGSEPLDDLVEGLTLGLSAGLAVGSPEDIMEMWAAADAALYAAKSSGGHRVSVAPLANA